MKNGPYILVVAPKNYPGTLYRNRYVYEHHLVWWEHTKEILLKGEVIHHIDENKHNNHISNLEKIKKEDHSKLHKKPIEWKEIICSWCNSVFSIEARNLRWKLKIGQKNYYCSRSHQVKDQWKNRKHE